MYKKMKYLSEDAKKIREEVFVREQGFENEFDEIDDFATHLVFYEGEEPIAVCRYYKSENPKEYWVGRLAILKQYRGRQIGRYMLEVMEENIKEEGGAKISLSAQVRVQDFYGKMGYLPQGEAYLDEHCQHVHMEKKLYSSQYQKK